MEATTPEGEIGSGGMGTVAIWELEVDEKDTEIGDMTDVLQGNLRERCHRRHHPPGGNTQGIAGSAKALTNGGDSLCITGHSSYYMNGRVKSLDERQLGGYPIEVVSAELSSLLLYPGYTHIELWCCETARNNSSEQLQGGADLSFSTAFDFQKFQQVQQTTTHANVSTLDYLCMKVVEKLLRDDKFARVDTLSIVGLTGVGYFMKGMHKILTIGPSAREEALELRTLEAERAALVRHKKKPNPDQLAKIEKLDNKVRTALDTRGCHYVVNTLNFKELREAEEKRRVAAKQAAQPVASPSGADSGKKKKGGWNDTRK